MAADRYDRNYAGVPYRSYVGGTAAPKYEPEPARRGQPRRQPVRRRAYVKVERIRPAVVVSWLAASLALIVSCGILLTAQSKMSSYVDKISVLETQIGKLRGENNLELARTNESVDLDYIKDQAINRLGMVKLTSDQIINYEYDGSDYVRQYKNVSASVKDSKKGLIN